MRAVSVIGIKLCELKGRTVVAKQKIGPGELIERAPVIVFTPEEWILIDQTILNDYCFRWGEKQGAVALGFGSLYNHSFNPNAKYRQNLRELAIDFVALKEIKVGEEITVNYNGAADDLTPVWFEVIE